MYRPRFALGFVCFVLRRPWLLRWAAAWLRRYPIASSLVSALAGHDAVMQAFARSASFPNTSHARNLVAGEFVIGIQDGPRHADERQMVERLLLDPAQLAQACSKEAQALRAAVEAKPTRHFDLIDDYLGPTAWRTLEHCLAGAADPAICGGGHTDRKGGEPQLLRKLRHVGSHLVVGAAADASTQGRAEAAGAMLQRRLRIPALRRARPDAFASLSGPQAIDDDAVGRACVGLMWVAHPATVQAGAHALIELMARPSLYKSLQDRVLSTGCNAAADPELRKYLSAVVLELLRFRPPFPLLVRDVPRAELANSGDTLPMALRAGATLRLLVIGALFDERVVSEPKRFSVDRIWRDPETPWLVFGSGPRRCPAREHVMEMLVSMMMGLLQMPRLRWARPWHRSPQYDGPAIAHFPLRF